MKLSQIMQRQNFAKNNPEIAKVRNEISTAQRKVRLLKKRLLELQVKK